VLLHAFPLDRRMWAEVRARLGVLDLILVDLPGFGDSPSAEGPPSLDTYADAVADVLDRTGHRRAILAGVSMGGYVIMSFARRHRERLAGAALVDTKADADTEEAAANRERIATAVTGDAGTRALAPMIDTLLGATTRSSRPEVVAWVREALAAAPPAGVAWAQRAMACRPDSIPTLRGLDVPTVVLVGEEDTLTPPQAAREIAAVLPDAVLGVVPRGGHLSPLECPEAVADALLGLVLRVRVA